MSALKKDSQKTTTAEQEKEAPVVENSDPARSVAEEAPTERDLVGGSAVGATIGGLVGGATGAALGGMLGLTGGALREGGKKKKRSGW